MNVRPLRVLCAAAISAPLVLAGIPAAAQSPDAGGTVPASCASVDPAQLPSPTPEAEGTPEIPGPTNEPTDAAAREIPLPQLTDDTLSVSAVVGGLDQPTSFAFIGRDDILITEKATGR